MYLHQLFLFIGFAIVAPLSSWANLVNITVDDSGVDPTNSSNAIIYSPNGGWSTDAICNFGGCTSQPDKSRIQDGTWHDSTFSTRSGNVPNQPLVADFQFTGVAVHVFAVLRGGSRSDMTFYINGTVFGTFFDTPLSLADGEFQYNTTVFSVAGLTQGTHHLRIQNGRVDGTKSLMILDSIVYTHDYYL